MRQRGYTGVTIQAAMSGIEGETIFNPDEIIEACKNSISQGGDNPLGRVFSISKTNRLVNSARYAPLWCSAGGKKGKLILRFLKEVHSGNIEPVDEAEVARINATRSEDKIKRRERAPALCFRKYKKDKNSPTSKEDLESPDNVSKFYLVMEYLDSFFKEEIKRRVISEEIFCENGFYEPPKGPLDKVTFITDGKIASLLQKSVSNDSKKNPGSVLSNPMTRISIRFNNPETQTTFFNGRDPFRDKKTGKKDFGPLLIEGEPVTDRNIHMLKPRSVVSGIVRMTDVCFSNLGISIPSRVKVVIVEPPDKKETRATDVFDVDADPDDPDIPNASMSSEESAKLNTKINEICNQLEVTEFVEME